MPEKSNSRISSLTREAKIKLLRDIAAGRKDPKEIFQAESIRLILEKPKVKWAKRDRGYYLLSVEGENLSEPITKPFTKDSFIIYNKTHYPDHTIILIRGQIKVLDSVNEEDADEADGFKALITFK